ncbi:RHS repeat-associated protein [Blastococcus saxobsidens]|uniref:RHS repeat-associated protein n=1 Tax=Blastococcus saxobsidens TaxID=138336 RepID=A0A4Q7Y9Y6_9ACTN|nr:RHS repeat-associated protein [Blastococcus saxobsidens]
MVAGSATGVLAAPASAPSAKVAVSELLAPVLHGKATAAGSGSQSIRFSARTVGATTWNLLDGVSVAGTEAYRALPEGRLSIGQTFEYQIAHCDGTGCTAAEVKTGVVSPALGAGVRPGATRVPVTIGDRIGAQVDVGTGNLLVTADLFSLPRRSGSPLEVGIAYNSTTRARGESHFLNSVGASSSGWRLSTARDVRLRSVPGAGTVTYFGPNGLTGTFTADGAGGYNSPAGFKMTLSALSGGGWTLNDHGSGDTRHFAGNGLMTELVDRNGNATTFSYNTDGGLTSIRSDQGSAGASRLAVTLGGTTPRQIAALSQTADGAGGGTRSVTFTYDPDRNYLTGFTDAEGRTTAFFHGSSGNLNRITAPGGAVTSFSYDAYGRVESITQPTAGDPAGAVTRLLYHDGTFTDVADPNSDQTTAVDHTAHTRYHLTGDGWQLVQRAIDPAGHQRSATYTPFLDVASATDPAGTGTFGYDPAVNGGQSLTATTAPTGAGSSFAYGNTAQATRFQPTSGTDAQGRASTYTYNGAGNRLSAANASSAQASVTYNADGTVATATSPSGGVTTYGYDTVGQLTSITPPADSTLGTRSYTYDGYGRVATYTSGRGITETYTYDALDRVTAVDYSDPTPTVSYTYDTAGRTDLRTDASGTTDYGYDPLGRLTSRTHTATPGIAVTYSYDKAGNLASATNAAGTTTYAYDARNLVTRAVSPAGRPIEFTHDASGRRTDTWFNRTTDGYNGTTTFAAHTHTDYDASSRVARVWTARAGNDADRVTDFTYSYASPGTSVCAGAPAAGTDTGIRWTQTDNRTGAQTAYCYDTANRLISASTPGADTWAYSYDVNGNRTQAVKNGTVVQTLSVNAADQITSTGYGYDASGNTLTDSHGAATYNGADQMTALTDNAGTHTYTYAGIDQTELIAEGNGRTYTHGRTDEAGVPLIESFVSSGTTFAYLYDPAGTPLAILAGTNTHYLGLDGLGSVVAAVNHSGTHTAAWSYDPWGQATATAMNGSGIASRRIYGYAGGLPDRNTGLVHFGQRWYDPETGRFTQQDSLETLADPTRSNRYEYAAGNPINYVDPTGRDFSISGCGAAGLAIGIGLGFAFPIFAGAATLFEAFIAGASGSLLGTGFDAICSTF